MRFASLWIAGLLLVVASVASAVSAQEDVTVVPDGLVASRVASVQLHAESRSLDILLTDDGIIEAGTCSGAATIAADIVALYPTIPGVTDAIDWAEARMTQEIYGHGRAAAGDIPLPDAVERANPVTIVFAHYTDPLLALRDFDAWAFQRAYTALYRADCL